MNPMYALGALLLSVAPQCQPPTTPSQPCQQVAVIGDSLTAQGNAELRKQLPAGTIINARGGRTSPEGVEPARGVAESNDVDCWVFALGTNDIWWWNVTEDQSRRAVNDLLAIAGTDRVVWVLLEYGPGAEDRPDPELFNNLIPDNVTKVRPGVAATQAPDGVHLTANGYRMRAEAIAKALL
jgi:lysophospholipase L1-like esterase